MPKRIDDIEDNFGYRILRSRRGSAFLTAMVFLVVLLGLGAAFVQMSIQEVSRASRIRKETRAMNLAEAGLDYAAWRIYNENPTAFPVTYSGSSFSEGDFAVSVDYYRDVDGNIVANSLQVDSIGVSQGWTVEVKAIGQYMITPSGNNMVFDNALFSDADMVIQGTADIDGTVYSNGNITVKGSPVITGDATAAGWIKDTGGNVQGIKTEYGPKKALPTVDIQYYRANADYVYTSDQTFSNHIQLEGIVFVDGDVHISGQVEGQVVIVATGIIRVDGNTTLYSPESEFALVSTKKVKITGSARVEGTIYAHNAETPASVDGLGTADILGAVVADLIDSGGTLLVEYKKPTVELPGASMAPVQLDVVSWRRVR